MDFDNVLTKKIFPIFSKLKKNFFGTIFLLSPPPLIHKKGGGSIFPPAVWQLLFTFVRVPKPNLTLSPCTRPRGVLEFGASRLRSPGLLSAMMKERRRFYSTINKERVNVPATTAAATLGQSAPAVVRLGEVFPAGGFHRGRASSLCIFFRHKINDKRARFYKRWLY